MASPLDHNPHTRTTGVRTPGTLFLVPCMHNDFSSKFPGFSVCHPIYEEGNMTQASQHAIYSAIINTEATATFMFLPAWGRHMITNPYSKL
eukprot:595065-Pelagomonas_calceolata.AAC.1